MNATSLNKEKVFQMLTDLESEKHNLIFRNGLFVNF